MKANFLSGFFRFALGRGARPHPDDNTVSVDRRVGAKFCAAVCVGTKTIRVARVAWRRGGVVVQDVETFSRGANAELSVVFTPEILTAIRARSPKGKVVLGINHKVTTKWSDLDAPMIEKVVALEAFEMNEHERSQYLWEKASNKMVRFSVAGGVVRSIEKTLAEHDLTVVRCFLMPYVYTNIAVQLALSEPTDTVRIPMVLDDCLVVTLEAAMADRRWTNFRARPILVPRPQDDETGAFNFWVETLREQIVQMHRSSGSAHPLELVVLSTGVPESGWRALTEAVREINESNELPHPVIITRITEDPNFDFHALCSHP